MISNIKIYEIIKHLQGHNYSILIIKHITIFKNEEWQFEINNQLSDILNNDNAYYYLKGICKGIEISNGVN